MVWVVAVSRDDRLVKSVLRRTGRVLTVHDGSVLPLRGGDPGRPGAGQWWFTVGGGCEPGEPTAAAARREAREEAGLILPVDLGPVVLHRKTAFEFEGEWLEQAEDYYLCRVSSRAIATAGWTAQELRIISAHRWCSLAELQTTSELVYPEGLANLLATLIAEP